MLYDVGGPRFHTLCLHASYTTRPFCGYLRVDTVWEDGRVRNAFMSPGAPSVQPCLCSLSAMPGFAARLQSGERVSDPSGEGGQPDGHGARGGARVKGVRSPGPSASSMRAGRHIAGGPPWTPAGSLTRPPAGRWHATALPCRCSRQCGVAQRSLGDVGCSAGCPSQCVAHCLGSGLDVRIPPSRMTGMPALQVDALSGLKVGAGMSEYAEPVEERHVSGRWEAVLIHPPRSSKTIEGGHSVLTSYRMPPLNFYPTPSTGAAPSTIASTATSFSTTTASTATVFIQYFTLLRLKGGGDTAQISADDFVNLSAVSASSYSLLTGNQGHMNADGASSGLITNLVQGETTHPPLQDFTAPSLDAEGNLAGRLRVLDPDLDEWPKDWDEHTALVERLAEEDLRRDIIITRKRFYDGSMVTHTSTFFLCTAGCMRYCPSQQLANIFHCEQYTEWGPDDGDYRPVSVLHAICQTCVQWHAPDSQYVSSCPRCHAWCCNACGVPHSRPCIFDCWCQGEICGGLGCNWSIYQSDEQTFGAF
jgi:hypothetical protein